MFRWNSISLWVSQWVTLSDFHTSEHLSVTDATLSQRRNSPSIESWKSHLDIHVNVQTQATRWASISVRLSPLSQGGTLFPHFRIFFVPPYNTMKFSFIHSSAWHLYVSQGGTHSSFWLNLLLKEDSLLFKTARHLRVETPRLILINIGCRIFSICMFDRTRLSNQLISCSEARLLRYYQQS